MWLVMALPFHQGAGNKHDKCLFVMLFPGCGKSSKGTKQGDSPCRVTGECFICDLQGEKEMPDEEQRGTHARQGIATAGGLLLHRAWKGKEDSVAKHVTEGVCGQGSGGQPNDCLEDRNPEFGFYSGSNGNL